MDHTPGRKEGPLDGSVSGTIGGGGPETGGPTDHPPPPDTPPPNPDDAASGRRAPDAIGATEQRDELGDVTVDGSALKED